ncbi:MAG TPA: hypothetical protein VN457_03590 [Chlamydiales bacterium]|nr:hypothetical protein [Chlamydiales bacterium]
MQKALVQAESSHSTTEFQLYEAIIYFLDNRYELYELALQRSKISLSAFIQTVQKIIEKQKIPQLLQEAREDFQMALSTEPAKTDIEANIGLANVLVAEGRWMQAQEAFQKMVAKNNLKMQ